MQWRRPSAALNFESSRGISMRFANKVVLVTGGSQGIGEATCRRFAAEGAKVAVVASSSIEKAQRVVDGIVEAGGEAHSFRCDVTSVEQIESLVDCVLTSFGYIDVLVNSAGVFYPTRIGQTDEGMFDRMCDINLKGSFFMCNAVAMHMIERGSGKIINIGSASGIVGRRDFIIYSATKAAVIHMTRALAVALAPHGINVNVISPGNTETPMNESIRKDPENAGIRETIAQRTPSKRLFADPNEIAGAAVFLASDDAQSMFGSMLLMDQGMTAGY
jgi:NAD(P)-dependent dehydrogenase (short-subunit alcohol dehydrogenase family)